MAANVYTVLRETNLEDGQYRLTAYSMYNGYSGEYSYGVELVDNDDEFVIYDIECHNEDEALRFFKRKQREGVYA